MAVEVCVAVEVVGVAGEVVEPSDDSTSHVVDENMVSPSRQSDAGLVEGPHASSRIEAEPSAEIVAKAESSHSLPETPVPARAALADPVLEDGLQPPPVPVLPDTGNESSSPEEISDYEDTAPRMDCKCGASFSASCLQEHLNLFCPCRQKSRRTGSVDAVVEQFESQVQSNRPVSNAELKEYQHLFDEAKLKEFANWSSERVMDEIFLEPQEFSDILTQKNVIGVRWVITWKRNVGPKCRLVAKGFEDLQASTLRTDSPTISKLSLMLALQHCVDQQWIPHCLDLKTAFLQSDPYSDSENREIYLIPPDDAYRLLKYPENRCVLWRLRKTTYGLKDAPLVWYKSLTKFLTEKLGMKSSSVDDSLFFEPENGVLAVHVDDLIFGGRDSFHALVQKLCSHYKVGSLDKGNFTYCGVQISVQYSDDDSEFSLVFDQAPYILSLSEMPIGQDLRPDVALSKREQTVFRSLLGKINWIALQTRPDISFATNQLSLKMSQATVDDAFRLNSLVRSLKRQARIPLRIVRTRVPSRIFVMSDASYSDNSTGGFLLLCASSDNKTASILKWSSTKIRRVTTSSTASEAFALRDGIDCAIQSQRILLELSGRTRSIVAFTDSRPLRQACYSRTKITIREFNVKMIVRSIREKLETGEISEVRYINTKCNLADYLTKHIANKELLHSVMSTNHFDFPV